MSTLNPYLNPAGEALVAERPTTRAGAAQATGVPDGGEAWQPGAGTGDSPVVWPTGPGAILALIRAGQATTRARIMRHTGLSRSTVAQRLEALQQAGYITETTGGEAQRGRPAGTFGLNREWGVLLVADIGVSHTRAALTDMAAGLLDERTLDLDVSRGPEEVLGTVRKEFEELLHTGGRGWADVRGAGLGVPGPVEFATGRVVSPPVMTGWDGYRVPDFFTDTLRCPVLVDNDVNVMTLGEHRTCWPAQPHLVFVKAGTGIGSGYVLGGTVHRGAQGAAGDVGHIPAPAAEPHLEPPLCRCGNTGCVEAYAGGWALIRDLRAHGLELSDTREVVALVRSGNLEAVRLVRGAGRILGQAIADMVSLLNPSVVVIGGDLPHAGEHLLAGIREVVYHRSPPLATRDLRIVASELNDRAGVLGAAHMVTDALYHPAVVDRALAQG